MLLLNDVKNNPKLYQYENILSVLSASKMIQQHTSIWLYQQQKQKNQNVIEIKPHVHFGLYLAFAWHAEKKIDSLLYCLPLNSISYAKQSINSFFIRTFGYEIVAALLLNAI